MQANREHRDSRGVRARLLALCFTLAVASLIYGFRFLAQAETRLYHLHAENSAVDTAARLMSVAGPDAAETTMTGLAISSTGGKLTRSFETQTGGPNNYYNVWAV